MSQSILPHTTILVSKWLLKDLANLVIMYFRAKDRHNWTGVMYAGEYETCIRVPKISRNKCMLFACQNNYLDIAELMYSYQEKIWKSPYCTHGMNTWLRVACRNNRKEIAQFVITHGGNDLEGGFADACRCGHTEIAKLIVSHKCNVYCFTCEKFACDH